jgi:membrane fusion protein (multidrug efflux system)
MKYINSLLLAAGVAISALPVLAEGPAPLTCLLAPARISDIGTDLRGIVAEVAVDRAAAVALGDPLVRLDTEVATAQRQLAQVRVDGLSARLSRSADLVSRNLISRDEIEQLGTELEIARMERARAELDIARSTIRAPFAGVVASLNVVVGELSGTDPLLTLIDLSELRAEMVFVDGVFGTIAVGDSLRLAIDLVGADVTAQVTAIDPFIDPASNSFTVIARVPNADGALPAGVSCRMAADAP